MKKISLLPDSPQVRSSVTVGLKDKILSVRSPVATALVRLLAPALQQAMHTAAVGRHLPDLVATGCQADRKSQSATVRGPAQPERKIWWGRELVRGTGLGIDDLEIASVRNQQVAIGHPGSVRRKQVA